MLIRMDRQLLDSFGAHWSSEEEPTCIDTMVSETPLRTLR